MRTATVIIALATVACAAAVAIDHHAHPHYKYSYGVHDHKTGDNKKAEESRNGDVTKGSYSFVQPDGVTRTVTYVVDGKSGFKAQVHYKGVAAHPGWGWGHHGAGAGAGAEAGAGAGGEGQNAGGAGGRGDQGTAQSTVSGWGIGPNEFY